MWLVVESMGVVSGWCCKVVHIYIYIYIYRYPHNNKLLIFPTPLVLALWQQHPYFFVQFLNVFSFLFIIFVQYSKICSKNIQEHSRSFKNRDHANMAI